MRIIGAPVTTTVTRYCETCEKEMSMRSFPTSGNPWFRCSGCGIFRSSTVEEVPGI